MRIALSKAAQHAFTKLELIVVVVVVFLGVFVFMSALNSEKGKSPRVNCTSSLKQTALAFVLWSNDNGTGPDSPRYPTRLHEVLGTSTEPADNRQMVDTFVAISTQLYTPRLLICPGDKKRKPAESFKGLTTRNISYFLAMDLNATNANQVLLGDRDVAVNKTQAAPGILRVSDPDAISWAGVIHGRKEGVGGNVALIDGSAHQVTSKGLRDLLPYNGFANNNRFLIP